MYSYGTETARNFMVMASKRHIFEKCANLDKPVCLPPYNQTAHWLPCHYFIQSVVI